MPPIFVFQNGGIEGGGRGECTQIRFNRGIEEIASAIELPPNDSY